MLHLRRGLFYARSHGNIIAMKRYGVPGLRILILAAGFSARLGQPKALARIRGLSLLRRTARLLAPHASRPLILVTPPRCIRYRHELRGLDAWLVANPGRATGLSGSLRCGLAHARWSAATLIVPVDLAELQRVDVVRLLRRWQGARRRIAARRIGARGGTPLVLPKRYYGLAQGARGDVGLRDLLQELAADERLWIDMPSAARDIDTPGDLTLARRVKIPR
jgi:molybdenum cofactor cytidylyltransferase